MFGINKTEELQKQIDELKKMYERNLEYIWDVQEKVKLLENETFIDQIVERINKKQLKGK